MSKRMNRVARIGWPVYIVLSFMVVLNWSQNDWESMGRKTHTIELEYVHISPTKTLIGEKGSWICDNGQAAFDGQGPYPCDIQPHEEPYDLGEKISWQMIIWAVGAVCAFWVGLLLIGLIGDPFDRKKINVAQ